MKETGTKIVHMEYFNLNENLNQTKPLYIDRNQTRNGTKSQSKRLNSLSQRYKSEFWGRWKSSIS